MAIYRTLYTKFWEDDKVLDEMSMEEKLLYIYLLTNPRVKQCGCYAISFHQIFLQTNISKENAKKIIERFEKELNLVKYSKNTKEILLLNFYKYNWTPSHLIKTCIEKELNEVKEPVFIEYIKKMIEYKYPINRVSIPLGEKEKEKENKNKKENINNINNSERENIKINNSSCDFVAPTLTEIFNYSRSLNFDDKEYCEKFYNHYESIGWVNGTGQEIKNWKLVFNNWLKKDKIGEFACFKEAKKEELDENTKKELEEILLQYK